MDECPTCGVPEIKRDDRFNYIVECGCSTGRASIFGRAYDRWASEIADKEQDEYLLCGQCAGSGEGMHDGTTCTSCNGRGSEQWTG